VVESRPLAYSVSKTAQQTLMNHAARYLHAELAGKFTSLGEAKACHHPHPLDQPYLVTSRWRHVLLLL